MHLTPYQFGMNSPVMYNDPTGLLVSGAGYVARPGLQRGVDGYYKAPWEAEFEWNDEGFFDWNNHGVGGGNYSSINGITTKQVLSKKRPGEKLDFYRGEFGFWQPFTGHSNKVSETGLQDVVVGTRFVSWDNAQAKRGVDWLDVAGWTVDVISIAIDIADFPSGEAALMIAGRKALWAKIRANMQKLAMKKAAKGVTQAESKIFLVTKEGVVLPKGAKIPGEFIENAHRSSNYGVMQNGKFVEKLRIDPATPSGFKGPNQSHFHLNNGGHIFEASKWPWW